MTKKIAPWAAAMAALAGAGSLSAHHSVSMIDVSTSVWVKGTVVRYEAINPHTRIELDETRADGQVQRWTIEGPFPGRLQRILRLNGMGPDEDFVRAGDVIEVCGFRPKRQAPYPDDLPLSYVHGHVLVMPDGRMQSWGPYGKLDNCIRPDDQPQAWLEFLNADPLAREFWCNSRHFVGVASTAPKGFVDEIDGLITNLPCQ
jgi:hypothetical protein